MHPPGLPALRGGPRSWRVLPGPATAGSAARVRSASASRSTIPATNACPGVRQLPDSRPVQVADTCRGEELRTALACNEMGVRAARQDRLAARLAGPDGARITGGRGDPVAAERWVLAEHDGR